MIPDSLYSSPAYLYGKVFKVTLDEDDITQCVTDAEMVSDINEGAHAKITIQIPLNLMNTSNEGRRVDRLAAEMLRKQKEDQI